MRAHVIVDGKILNTIEVESMDFKPNQGSLVEAVEGSIGDGYVNGVVIPAPVIPPVSPVFTKEELMAKIVELQAQIDAIK